MEYKNLFSPITLANQEIRNRIMVAPAGIGLDSQYHYGRMSSQYTDYYETMAKGGAGLVVSEFTAVDKRFHYMTLGLFDRDQMASISRTAEAVRVFGSKFLVQISHFGGKAPRNYVLNDPMAPSSITSRMYPEMPREMTLEDVEEVIGLFIRSGVWACEAGCDGVELHAAHGYLLGQFVSPHANRREDEYGGSVEKRLKAVTKISTSIRDQCGEDFIIGLKFSAHEHLEGGIDLEYAKEIAQFLDKHSVLNYLHVSAFSTTLPGLLECDYPSVPPVYIKPPLVPLAGEIKKGVKNKRIIATGGITDPEYAESILSEGKADMVALGRALIADPEWPKKAKKGRPIMYCVRCNICYKRVMNQQSVKCSVNPYVGEERRYAQYKRGKADTSLRVCVVGAGPGGMEAAVTADRRGHDVVLFEKKNEVGGYLRLAGVPDFKVEFRKLLKSYERILTESGVEVRTGIEATPEKVMREKPDAVILALGARPFVPDIKGLSSDKVVNAVDLLADGSYGRVGSSAAIIGAGFIGCEVALHLCQKIPSIELKIVDLLKEDEILADEPPVNRSVLLWELKKGKVEILSGHKTIEINEEGLVAVDDRGDTVSLPADTVILSAGFRPLTELSGDFKEKVNALNPDIEVYKIGDCVKCDKIYHAINSGAHAAWRLGGE
jgi:2,4-dienoyl-CoA reductase-like NADH-dependent reductase (Old Yellow Enzyme family)/thioredoxin reductase